MAEKEFIVIKIGGRAAAPESLQLLAHEMASQQEQYNFIFVHGGGAEVSRISGVFGLDPVF